MDYVRTTDAATEPVTATELKNHLRIDHTDEDTMISSMISAARRMAEEYCHRTFITSTWKAYMDDFPSYFNRAINNKENSYVRNVYEDIRLPMGRVISVTSVDYATTAAHDTPMSSSDYYVALETEIGIIRPVTEWPDTDDEIPNGVEITYTAGYGANASDVPQDIKNAILIIASDLYEHRETHEQMKTRLVSYDGWKPAWQFMLDPYVIHYS